MRTLVLVLTAAWLAGCASHGVRSRTPPEGWFAAPRSLLTADEIGQTSVSTALQAIQLLRPQWLWSRGGGMNDTQPRTYVDLMLFGGVPALRAIDVHEVQEVRLLNAVEATMRFGAGHATGAILITTRRGTGPSSRPRSISDHRPRPESR